MGDYLLMVVTVAIVGGGGYYLGRASLRDHLNFLRDEVDTYAQDAQAHEPGGNHPAHRYWADE